MQAHLGTFAQISRDPQGTQLRSRRRTERLPGTAVGMPLRCISLAIRIASPSTPPGPSSTIRSGLALAHDATELAIRAGSDHPAYPHGSVVVLVRTAYHVARCSGRTNR